MGLKDAIRAFLKETFGNNQNESPDQNNSAEVVVGSNLSPWSNRNLIKGLTPGRLGDILAAVRQGQIPTEYLELCQEIERRDLHYRSVLSTRKHSVEGLDLQVEAGGEDALSVKIAEAVRQDIAKHDGIRNLIKDSLDALGKGFSVTEVVWDFSDTQRWRPLEFLHQDPRWFAYSRANARTLCKLDDLGIAMTPIDRRGYVIHEPRLLSGPQIFSGLSYTALFLWLIKHSDVASWAAFVDRFGYPVRLGKYGKKATRDDINTLKRAVAAIGSDVGAVIPDSMLIDIVESKTTGTNASVYERLADWADRQISKLVLGQTASSDGTPGKLGNEKAQEEVRQDIIDADAAQLEQTLNRDLVKLYVDVNFGEQPVYPRLILRRVESQDVQMTVDALAKLVPMGLNVKQDEVRSLLNLTKPEKGDEVLAQPTPPSAQPAANGQKQKFAVNAEEPEPESDFVPISDEIASVLEQAADASTDFEDFKKKLEALVTEWPADKIAELVAVATFKARAQGDADFDNQE